MNHMHSYAMITKKDKHDRRMNRQGKQSSWIDRDGFRANVGIVLINKQDQIFLGRRVGGHNAWQLPQGGIQLQEPLEQALYRELDEEVGIGRDLVRVEAQIKHWIYYRLPAQYIRHHVMPLCIGQKQKWFLLRYLGEDEAIQVTKHKPHEFDDWVWVDFWEPLKRVVDFKKHVYREVLRNFESTIAS